MGVGWGGAGSGFSRWHVALGLGLLVLGALCTASTFSEPRRHSPHPSVAPLVHSAEFGRVTLGPGLLILKNPGAGQLD